MPKKVEKLYPIQKLETPENPRLVVRELCLMKHEHCSMRFILHSIWRIHALVGNMTRKSQDDSLLYQRIRPLWYEKKHNLSLIWIRKKI